MRTVFLVCAILMNPLLGVEDNIVSNEISAIEEALVSAAVIVVPDYAPYADTLFDKRDISDYTGDSFWEKIQYLLTQNGYKVSAVNEDNLPKQLGKKDLLVCWSDALSLDQLKQYSSSNLAILMFHILQLTKTSKKFPKNLL